MSKPRETDVPLRRRVARLTLLSLALLAVSAGLFVLVGRLAFGVAPSELFGGLPLGPSGFPSISLVVAAGAAAAAIFLGLSALHVAAAMRVLARDRRIPAPLSPELRAARSAILAPLGRDIRRMAVEPELPATRLPPRWALGDRLQLTVLVPAHDEAATIEAALTSLWGQTRPPDRVIVVADNCTDDTAAIAARNGAEVFTTVANTEKKAGALNQALTQLFRDVRPGDVAMVMDADSTLVPDFLEVAMERLEADPDLMAVGGVFYGDPGAGLTGLLQRNEYTRYQRHISRRLGKVFVLTGTASLFRTFALKAVADSRGELLPGSPGQVYDTLAMTEDNEMTLSLKTLGAKMVSPMQCRVYTEVMPDWRALWRQRMRWQRGALENIGAYGLTRATIRYWLQQAGIGYGTIALNAYLFLLLITLLASDGPRFLWFWVGIGTIFVVERVVTVWPAGWRARLVAATLFVEIGYDLFLQAVYVKSIADIAGGRKAGWNYVPREVTTT